jgi:hypothetical protein
MSSYKSVVPRTQLASYGPGVEVNFDLLHDGESIVPGSLFLTGELDITCATARDGTLEHYMDPEAGVGAFLENVITRCDVFQEVITNYGRLCKHNAMLQYSPDQRCAGLMNTCEMRPPNVRTAGLFVDSSAPGTAWSFCHKPIVAINNMSGPLSSTTSGRIQFSFKCPSTNKVFFGADSADLTAYKFTNLQLHYKTELVEGQGPVSVNIVQDTQKLIATSRVTIMNTFPDLVDKVVVSFAQVTTEQNAQQNSLVCQYMPIKRISWVYNDVSNRLVSYNIESAEELVLSGLSAMKAVGVAMDVRDKLAIFTQDPAHSVSDKFCIGLTLGQQMDFSRSGLGVTVELGDNVIQNQGQYYAFFFAYGSKVIA